MHMANLTLKGVPNEVVAELKKHAEVNRRSLNGEVVHRLERSLNDAYDASNWLQRARQIRESRPVLTSASRIIKARDAGRK
jgi:hypothetical protein